MAGAYGVRHVAPVTAIPPKSFRTSQETRWFPPAITAVAGSATARRRGAPAAGDGLAHGLLDKLQMTWVRA